MMRKTTQKVVSIFPTIGTIFHSNFQSNATDPAILQHRREGAERARKRNVLAKSIAAKLDSNPQLAEDVVAKLSADKRRELLVVASGKEWYPSSSLSRLVKYLAEREGRLSSSTSDAALKEAAKIHESTLDAALPDCNSSTTRNSMATHAGDIDTSGAKVVNDLRSKLTENKHLNDADTDKDNRISEKDYFAWVNRVVSQRQKQIIAEVPMSALIRLAFYAGCPFVAFGFMDNCVMLVSGDYIGNTIGERFKLTAMAAAALGGVVSGTFGMQVHGIAEKGIGKLGLRPPTLSAAQLKNPSVFTAGHIGGTVGITIGLCCGMMPLLFIEAEESHH